MFLGAAFTPNVVLAIDVQGSGINMTPSTYVFNTILPSINGVFVLEMILFFFIPLLIKPLHHCLLLFPKIKSVFVCVIQYIDTKGSQNDLVFKTDTKGSQNDLVFKTLNLQLQINLFRFA